MERAQQPKLGFEVVHAGQALQLATFGPGIAQDGHALLEVFATHGHIRILPTIHL
jgi:hypothetical protein